MPLVGGRLTARTPSPTPRLLIHVYLYLQEGTRFRMTFQLFPGNLCRVLTFIPLPSRALYGALIPLPSRVL